MSQPSRWPVHPSRRITVLRALALMTLGVGSPATSQETVRVGFVIDGPWERNDEIRGLFEQELLELLGREFDVQFPARATLVADWTADSVGAALDALLTAPDVDLVIALGVLASVNAARRDTLPIPVIAPFVLDIGLEGIPRTAGASGVGNLSYVLIPNQIGRDIEAFLELVSFQRLTVLMNARYATALPEMHRGLDSLAGRLGVALRFVPVESVDQAVAALDEVDAVYLGPLLHLPAGSVDRLIAALNERRLPTFSLIGEDEVRSGALAGLNPSTFWLRVARRTALNAQRMLLGEAAATIPVAFAREEQLTINMATARAIQVFPPWSALTEAALINEVRRHVERQLTLADVMQEAVAANLDLAAQNFAVSAGAQDIRAAVAALLPQVDVSALGALIDADRAEASFGAQPQRSLTGNATISQLLFSEPAWANVSIQQRLQRAREFERDGVALDIGRVAAVAYLNVLRGKTLERINRENLHVTRTNLDLARVRVEVGTAGSGEVFRLESQIAADRRDVITSNARRNQAEIGLNQVLHRPLEEPFATADATLEEMPLVGSDGGILRYMSNPYAFDVFREFMVEEALAAAPELRQLDAAIAAQERALASARASYWAPTIALQGALSSRLLEGGAGTDVALDLPPGTPDLSGAFPQTNDLSWSVGFRVSLPVFEGSRRYARSHQAADDLSRLTIQRGAAAERVEQRVRSALHAGGASYASIALARDGADAARRSLEVVTDAYSRGVASLVDLLDAQNAATVADLVAANAVYDFLRDLIEVERAVGRYQLLGSRDDRARFFERLEAYFTQAGLSPAGR